MNIYRKEHPKPQFYRESWQNLNGVWDFEFDFENLGLEKGYLHKEFSKKINVPFCPESKLSGIEYKGFMNAVWYRRTFNISSECLGQRVLLHFGAVDFNTHVWINNQQAGSHIGGYSSFCFDITEFITLGENAIALQAQDDCRDPHQPRGKQCEELQSCGCDYTRTTGIWQTVWLEFVPQIYLSNAKVKTNYRNGQVIIDLATMGYQENLLVKATVFYGNETVANSETPMLSGTTTLSFKVDEPKLWQVGSPNLYDIRYEIVDKDDKVLDCVQSYFGIRTVEIINRGFYINGQPIFLRTILDQGFYPDGIYTAPSDDDLKRDIELSMQLGFNGARLHQKVFEERFLYWADKLGYIVFGEYGSWGLDITTPSGISDFLPEWLEVIKRDYSHPSIIGWCPFNETWDLNGIAQCDDVLKIVYLATKAADDTRPCIDTSGNYHVITDIYDVHDYEQNKDIFCERYSKPYDELYETHPNRQHKSGQPYFMSEYGGARWAPKENDDKQGWGYGEAPKTEAEVGERFEALSTILLQNPDIIGYCYTQLTDIEQEQNGLYSYDRNKKFSDEVYELIKKTNYQIAEFEKINRR